MTFRALAVATVLMVVASGCSSSKTEAALWPSEPGSGPCAVTKQVDVPATMRDGTVLRADVYRPQTSDQVPVIPFRDVVGNAGMTEPAQ